MLLAANTGEQKARFEPELETRYLALLSWFAEFQHCVVAFSGGVDSAFVLKAALQALGREKVQAVIADSPSLARTEFAAACELAYQLSAKLEVVQTSELSSEGYQANAGNRCYFCKSTLYQSLTQLLESKLTHAKNSTTALVVVDGTNLDDLQDIRPGRKAAEEAGVRHPLVETAFTKQMVRDASKALGLPTWDKPAMACLASRITVGDRVTAAKLSQVEQAEHALREFGFRQVRVRHHELSPTGTDQANSTQLALARIELDPEELPRAIEPQMRASIVNAVKAAGFAHVAIDIEGYKKAGGGGSTQ